MMLREAVPVTTVVCLIQLCCGELREPVIQTEYGAVQGTVRRAIGSARPVYSYFGVQYGRSPDYVFRFRPAEDPWEWEGVRDATGKKRPLCVQDRGRYESIKKNTFMKYVMPDNPIMSENCLVLDIFTPTSPNGTTNDKGLLPVILWIHGGSFDAFCSSTKLWALSAFEDIVLVQVQYRLGTFGFLTTEDEWAPPNAAFHDHLKAMRWVQRNIKSFGGDPNSVTLMGQSAGAVAVTAHTLLPQSKGLFHRVFATSGAPNSMAWKLTNGDAVQRIAEIANCNFGRSSTTSTCLRNKISTSRLMNITKELSITFGLLADRTLFPDSITRMIEKKSFASRVPVMIGVTNGEHNYLLPRKMFPNLYAKGASSKRDELVAGLEKLLEWYYPLDKISRISNVVTREYMNEDKLGNEGMELFRGFLKAVEDCHFVSKATKFAEKMKESGQDVYFFDFTFKPSMYFSRRDEFVRPYNFTTADHGDDLLYAFGFPFIPELAGGEKPILHFTDEERDLSRKYMHTIASFAKTGSPPKDVHWQQYPKYVEIGRTLEAKKESFHANQMHLWNTVVYKLAYGT